ncbi:MAG: hypothetical protein KIH69_021575 [Anaerolineae bacterium]|nr:hypothetical protein [Anaerolineae bacterium]
MKSTFLPTFHFNWRVGALIAIALLLTSLIAFTTRNNRSTSTTTRVAPTQQRQEGHHHYSNSVNLGAIGGVAGTLAVVGAINTPFAIAYAVRSNKRKSARA